MRLIFAVVLGLMAPVGALACAKPNGASGLEAAMVTWINDQRTAHGLNRLRPSDKLTAAAQGHACDMATRNYFGHQRAGGPPLGARVKAEGYRVRRVAENIAKVGSPDVARAASVWRNSPAHWQNILSPGLTEIGVATAAGGASTFWVMNIGTQR
ncbi:MAG: CAP domain-containing protein [Rhodobacteraceae bacterium]|nr:CAP domain-containing protein [Paracoccaceae bacterium]